MLAFMLPALLQQHGADLPLLMQHPTMNQSEIVFQFADDLWSVGLEGGEAHRLTSGRGVKSRPIFSPDGKWLAYTADYDGNLDAYVMPAEGGEPKRLTAHPDPDVVVGWTRDSKSVLFLSQMLSNTDAPRLFTASISNPGIPKQLPFPSAGDTASFSPDGKYLAYVPNTKWELAWKRYRGGQAYRIWLGDLADSHVKQIPQDKGSNDECPMWIGDNVYFLSDRNGPVGLYSYNTASGRVSEQVAGSGFDIKSASAGPKGIVYEKLGGLYVFDTAKKASRKVPVSIHGDFAESRAQFKNIAANLESASLSPSGARVVVSGRGWIATVPAKKGDARVLGSAQGLHRRDPAWSPDAKTIAYITDADKGRQQLALWDVASGTEKRVELGEAPNFYNRPVWSPDGSMIAYSDYRSWLWTYEVKTGKNTKVSVPTYGDPTHSVNPVWSPDSKWLTYSRDLGNHYNAIFLYEVSSNKSTQITDGLANADSPIFDRSGKYLYFYASTNFGAKSSWLDLSNLTIPNVTSSVYAVVLKKDAPNPLHPESDEETPKADAPPAPAAAVKDAPKEAAKPVLVDLDGIETRIITLPMPKLPYVALVAGPNESFFALSTEPNVDATRGAAPGGLWKFSMATRSAAPFSQGVTAVDATPDGSKLLLGHGPSWQIVQAAAPAAGPGEGAVNLSNIPMKVDPRAEWRHMLSEIWENERNCFYAANAHGLDTREVERRYAPFFETVQSRRDLNYLLTDMMGELCIGHMWASGGDLPGTRRISVGLLGADYAVEGGKYKFARVYDGERWNPGLYAPLAQPGVQAKAGEFLLAIDGQELTQATDIYLLLEGKVGKQVRIKIGPNADGKGSREATVVPVGDEFELRQRAWTEDNRRYVEKMTGGRAGYVHIPDTQTGGWTEFQRYYYAQVGKDGIVVDERFNHGGLINDYMIFEMKKTLNGAFVPRYMRPWPTPGSAIFGPKVMLANEYSGSGGDMFPWLFKYNKVGKLVGKRTWGGLVAAANFALVDGGSVNAPDYAFFNVEKGTWDVENWGTAPDIEVELDPHLWRLGHDAQLDRAIEELNKALSNYKPTELKRPAYPDKTKLNIRY